MHPVHSSRRGEFPSVALRICDQNRGNDGSRQRLMAGDCFGRRYYCNHSHRGSSLEITVTSAADPTCYLHRLRHPLCCNQPWAVAVLRLAIRQKLKRSFSGRQSFVKAWQEVDAQLAMHFDLPSFDAYWELVEERRFERAQMKSARDAERGRINAAKAFIQQSGSATGSAKAQVRQCFILLGLKDRPTSMEQLKRAYRAAASATHPDQGGTAADFQAVQQAFEEAKRVMRFR